MVNMFLCRNVWRSVNLNHPATFRTLAMESDLKQVIMEDLERFLNRKEYYKLVGKAWKSKGLFAVWATRDGKVELLDRGDRKLLEV